MGDTAAMGVIGNDAAGALGSGAGRDIGIEVEVVCGVVALLGGSSLWNVVARSWKCCHVSDAIGDRRVYVWVGRRAAVRSLAAVMMIWSRVAVGILRLWGNHLTVLQIRVEAVEGIQMLWHW